MALGLRLSRSEDVNAVPQRPFKDFLDELAARPQGERPAVVDGFLNALPAGPCFEGDTVVHFLFRGDAETVSIPCDANEWSPSGFPMKRVEGTNLWYHSHTFESDARLDYKFLLNRSSWILDPMNPRRIEGGYGTNSELRMPGYVAPPELDCRADLPHGNICESYVRSEVLGNTRKVCVYTPAEYPRTNERYPVVLFHDGLEFLALGSLNHALDYLIARRRMAPVIGVFIPPVDRTAEYAGHLMGSYHTFITEEVLPFVDQRFRTRTTYADRATVGVSNGGNIALWLGLTYPEKFGKISAHSSNIVAAVLNGYDDSPRLNLKFYLDIGTYDIAQLVPRLKSFVSLVRSKGYPCVFRKYHEGHSWGNWRAHVSKALKYFFPPRRVPLSFKPSPVEQLQA